MGNEATNSVSETPTESVIDFDVDFTQTLEFEDAFDIVQAASDGSRLVALVSMRDQLMSQTHRMKEDDAIVLGQLHAEIAATGMRLERALRRHEDLIPANRKLTWLELRKYAKRQGYSDAAIERIGAAARANGVFDITHRQLRKKVVEFAAGQRLILSLDEVHDFAQKEAQKLACAVSAYALAWGVVAVVGAIAISGATGGAAAPGAAYIAALGVGMATTGLKGVLDNCL